MVPEASRESGPTVAAAGKPAGAGPAVIVIGAGPAGLMAAEVLSSTGAAVEVFDAMPTAGRKFLLAGIGGLNLTHAEPLPQFISRYGARQTAISTWLEDFGPDALRAWAQGLGVETFVGSSGRVFPSEMKAAPLLRAWLTRLRARGVQFHMRSRWCGFAPVAPASPSSTPPLPLPPYRWRFVTPQGERVVQANAAVLALGGGSWPQLGSDGAWLPWLAGQGVDVAPLLPANCGFDVRRRDAQGIEQLAWTPHFSQHFAGQPFKSVALRFDDSQGRHFARKGEFVATATGIEGSLVYAVSTLLRGEIAARGSACVELDLLPDKSPQQVLAQVAHPRGARSLTSHLKSRLGLDGIKMALLHELLSKAQLHDPAQLATAIKSLPITLHAPRPIAEAISSAGGVCLESMNAALMLNRLPGVFCAGEMLDWEAPTGGYLLTACFASGKRAGEGALEWLQQHAGQPKR
ncbi:MAG: TIGR03862 family flavoprotein [Burkholderiaceae bacterium]